MNAYEAAARLQKAMKLEHALVAIWEGLQQPAMTLADALEDPRLSDKLWKVATVAADVREPSAETKALVIRGLRLRERQRTEAELFAGTDGR